MRVPLPGGYHLYFDVQLQHPTPRHWRCGVCFRTMRFDQTDDRGRCGFCGGPVRRVGDR